MTTPTPETPLADRVRTIVFAFNRADTRRDAVRKLADDVANIERERDEIQNELNKCATQLVATINDRNFLGVQLDLIRDEMLRIAARILESGFEKHPNLSSILDYCGRAQKGIAVNYTPIQERDAWKEKASQLERERDELQTALSTALRERESARQNISTAAGKLVQSIAERDEWKNNYQTAYDEWQQSAVDRDAWKAKAERTCGISEIPDGKGLFYLMTNCGGHVNGRSDWCPHCGGRIVKEEKL